ncbi:anti-sigma factor domain-containing protein [Terrabacter sp. BE26]|uniref:anti-sigma factor n=1 Tax=Terrabacter sp. BE26 TaxID=2898152 RepID=UPI0035BE79B9
MSEDIHALSGAYAVDALDDIERERFERHLAGCSDCRAEVESLVAAASELSVLTEVPPPPSLRAKVLADIATVRPLPPVTPPKVDATDDTVTSAPPARPAGRLGADAEEPTAHGPLDESTRTTAATGPTDELDARRRSRAGRGFSRGWRLVVAAATVAVLAVAGFTVWRQVAKDPQQAIADQVLAAPDATRYGKRLPDGATATVVRSPSLQKAVLITSGMSQPPSGKVFQLWLEDATGHMTSAGLMPSGGDKVVVLAGDATHSKAAGVTVEPPGGSDQPTSAPVALIPFA